MNKQQVLSLILGLFIVVSGLALTVYNHFPSKAESEMALAREQADAAPVHHKKKFDFANDCYGSDDCLNYCEKQTDSRKECMKCYGDCLAFYQGEHRNGR